MKGTKVVLFLMFFYFVLDVLFGIDETSNRTLPYVFSIGMQALVIYLLYFESSKFKKGNATAVYALYAWLIMNICHLFAAFFLSSDLVLNIVTFMKFNFWAMAAILFFYWGANYNRTKKKEIIEFIYLISLITLVFISLRNIYISSFIAERSKGVTTELVNRNPYVLLWALPTLFLLKRKYNILITGLVVIAILVSAKRGPFICMALGLVGTFIFGIKIKIADLLKYSLIMILVITLIGVYYAEEFKYFLQRWSDTDGSGYASEDSLTSGRTAFWGILFKEWYDGSVIQQFFGFGLNQVSVTLSSTIGLAVFAHNDWVEIMFDYGIIGVIIYLSFHIGIVKLLYRAHRLKYKKVNILIFIYIMYLTSNFFTQSINGIHQGWIFLLLFFLLGDFYQKSTLIKGRKSHDDKLVVSAKRALSFEANEK